MLTSLPQIYSGTKHHHIVVLQQPSVSVLIKFLFYARHILVLLRFRVNTDLYKLHGYENGNPPHVLVYFLLPGHASDTLQHFSSFVEIPVKDTRRCSG